MFRVEPGAASSTASAMSCQLTACAAAGARMAGFSSQSTSLANTANVPDQQTMNSSRPQVTPTQLCKTRKMRRFTQPACQTFPTLGQACLGRQGGGVKVLRVARNPSPVTAWYRQMNGRFRLSFRGGSDGKA